jgi:hypothetical protein
LEVLDESQSDFEGLECAVDGELHAAFDLISEGLQQFQGFSFEYAVGLFVAAVLR